MKWAKITTMPWRLIDILEAIRALPKEQRNQLVEQLRRELEPTASQGGAADPGAIIGLFADEPELIDEVCERAMHDRERDPLRVVDG